MNATMRRIRALLELVRDEKVNANSWVEATFLLQKTEPRKRLKSKSTRPAKLYRETARAQRNDRMLGIRLAVGKRSNGRCELGDGLVAEEVHHLISGSGLRRRHEDESTCIALCEHHHRAAHRNDLETLEKLRLWAIGKSAMAAHCLGRRIEKLQAMQRKETA